MALSLATSTLSTWGTALRSAAWHTDFAIRCARYMPSRSPFSATSTQKSACRPDMNCNACVSVQFKPTEALSCASAACNSSSRPVVAESTTAVQMRAFGSSAGAAMRILAILCRRAGLVIARKPRQGAASDGLRPDLETHGVVVDFYLDYRQSNVRVDAHYP